MIETRMFFRWYWWSFLDHFIFAHHMWLCFVSITAFTFCWLVGFVFDGLVKSYWSLWAALFVGSDVCWFVTLMLFFFLDEKRWFLLEYFNLGIINNYWFITWITLTWIIFQNQRQQQNKSQIFIIKKYEYGNIVKIKLKTRCSTY